MTGPAYRPERTAPAGYRVLGNLANGPDVLGCLACGVIVWDPDAHTRAETETPAPPPKLAVEDVPTGDLL